MTPDVEDAGMFQESSRALPVIPFCAWKDILDAFHLSIACMYHWKSNHLGKGCWNTMLFPPSHRNPATDLRIGTSGCFSGGNLFLGTSFTGSLWLSALCQKPVCCPHDVGYHSHGALPAVPDVGLPALCWGYLKVSRRHFAKNSETWQLRKVITPTTVIRHGLQLESGTVGESLGLNFESYKAGRFSCINQDFALNSEEPEIQISSMSCQMVCDSWGSSFCTSAMHESRLIFRI